MEWKVFHPAVIPQNEIFLLCLDQDIFWAKACRSKIVTRSAFSDIEAIKDFGNNPRCGDISVFLHNLKKRRVTPLWCHFQKPEVSQ